jgi:hypothetical protein
MTLQKLKELNTQLTKDLYPYGIIFETGIEGLKLPFFIHALLRNEKPNPNNDDTSRPKK